MVHEAVAERGDGHHMPRDKQDLLSVALAQGGEPDSTGVGHARVHARVQVAFAWGGEPDSTVSAATLDYPSDAPRLAVSDSRLEVEGIRSSDAPRAGGARVLRVGENEWCPRLESNQRHQV